MFLNIWPNHIYFINFFNLFNFEVFNVFFINYNFNISKSINYLIIYCSSFVFKIKIFIIKYILEIIDIINITLALINLVYTRMQVKIVAKYVKYSFQIFKNYLLLIPVILYILQNLTSYKTIFYKFIQNKNDSRCNIN